MSKGVLVRLHDLVGSERPENVGGWSLLNCPRTGLSVNGTDVGVLVGQPVSFIVILDGLQL